MESVSLSLSLFLLLLTTTLAARGYRALASSYQRTADVEQFVKSCQAQAAEQAKSLRAQLKAAHAKYDSEKRANDSLRHEARTSLARREELATESARAQRDSAYHRGVNKTLREELRTAKETTSDVERAQRIQHQWGSVSDTLEKAGFVATNPEDLRSTIEKLQELRDSAEASFKQAALDKEELTTERAAKEAAQALNKQKDAEITSLRAQLEKMAKTNGATTSTSLQQQELSQTKTALADAQKTVKSQETANRAILEEGQALWEKHTKLYGGFNALIQRTRDGEEFVEYLKQKVAALSSDLAKAREVIDHGGHQVDALSKDLGSAKQEIAKHDQQVTALSRDLGNAKQEIAKHDQQATALSNDLANARKKVIDRDQEVARLSGELRDTQQESLKRDQEVTRLSDELAAAQQESLKRDHELTRLSNELAAKQLEVANNWTLIDSLSFIANTNNGTYGSANNMAIGSNDDPLISLLAATSLRDDGTNQNPSFDYSTPGAQAGTNFAFDGDGFSGSINNGGSNNMVDFIDSNAYGGPNNDRGSGNITSSSAPTDFSGLNNNGNFSGAMDFNDPQNLSEWDVYEGWTTGGDFSNYADASALGGSNNNYGDFSNIPDSSALGGFSGTDNNNGDLNNFAYSSAPKGFSDLNNYNGDLSMFTNPSALNDFSGSGNSAESNPPGPPASTHNAFMPPPAPTGDFTFAPQGQLPTMADHQPLKTEEVNEIVRASEGKVDGVDAQELLEVMIDHEHCPRSDDENGIDIRELPPIVQRSMFKYIRAQREIKELKKQRGNGEMEE